MILDRSVVGWMGCVWLFLVVVWLFVWVYSDFWDVMCDIVVICWLMDWLWILE